jgi:hypothetical protein
MKQSHIVIASTALTLASGGAAFGQSANPEIEELKQQVRALQEQVQTMKEGPKVDPGTEGLLRERFFKGKGLTIGFYGEAKYRVPESGPNSFDPHRFVLTPSYQISDWLVFNSELELEHGGVDETGADRRSRFGGELELEQMYVDILLNEHFNIRSFGIDLVPVGRINKYHEPIVFYSTERPELYREIIPSTWMEPSIGFFGKITENWDYQVMISAGIEDFDRRSRTGTPAGPTTGINATSGFRDSRPGLRPADVNTLAYSGRIHYNGIPGLDASASAYVTQVEGVGGDSVIALWDIEALYRMPGTGLELRGDFAYWHIADPEKLVANQNNVAANTPSNTPVRGDDVGGRMYGWYLEAAYHLWPEAWREGRGSDMDLVPFIRYSQIRTQSDLEAGSVYRDDGTANRDFITVGLSYFLNANFVLKADYRHNLDGTAVSALSASSQDYFQLGMGVAF